MSSVGTAPRAAVPPSAQTRAATPESNARAEASRRNGAKSRGPRTPEGKARAAQNALKHGMRAQRYVVLPDEDAVEFAQLQAALVEELAPVGALQIVLARRVAVAAWRFARADRMEAELFAERRWENGGVGIALIRDGNGTRSFETLLRYRGAAMAEFWRALRTLKALQAEQAALRDQPAGTMLALERRATKPAALAPGAPLTDRSRQPAPPQPTDAKREANRERVPAYTMPNEPEPVRTLHEAAARWNHNEGAEVRNPDEPETRGSSREIAQHASQPVRRTIACCPTG